METIGRVIGYYTTLFQIRAGRVQALCGRCSGLRSNSDSVSHSAVEGASVCRSKSSDQADPQFGNSIP